MNRYNVDTLSPDLPVQFTWSIRHGMFPDLFVELDVLKADYTVLSELFRGKEVAISVTIRATLAQALTLYQVTPAAIALDISKGCPGIGILEAMQQAVELRKQLNNGSI